ncbi:hypothetical protein GCM10027425_03680 [Alteromonas gracilis]
MRGAVDAVVAVVEGLGAWGYVVIAVVLLAESILIVGFVVPTSSVLFACGALVATDALRLDLLVLTAVAAVVVGEWQGRAVGRRLGDRLGARGHDLRAMPVATPALALVERGARRATFVGRFVPVVRTLVPHLVGAAGVRSRGLALVSAVSALIWVLGWSGAGRLTATGVGALLL